ncbi:MAG TPA: hypothetical protein VM509_15255 [Planctomycetota bacterium]|nr:hypothetical protein [Planctomycetota bacterium]
MLTHPEDPARPTPVQAATSTARGRFPQWMLPLLLSAALVGWQLGFDAKPRELDRTYKMSASLGMAADLPNLYFYFFHHFGLFPVGAMEVPELGPSRQDAEAFVAEHGDRLRMDFGLPTNTPRFGDYGSLFVLLPDVLLRGDPVHPSAILFNEILFVAALLALFWALWLEGYRLLAACIVVLVGSDPFQLFETYARGNIFSLPISVALLALATHVRFLSGRKGVDRWAWAIAIGGGVLLATFREIRSEAVFIGVSMIASYLLIRASPFRQRALLALAFVAAFTLTGQLWNAYWTRSFDRAEQFVARAGGQVYAGPRGKHHALWHSVLSGLGDHGGDRGFSWDDRVAFRWATTFDPLTNPRPLAYHYTDGYYFEETYDGLHHVAPTDVPEYNELARERVLSEIRLHPGWYAGILGKRVIAILRNATPASLALGTGRVGIFPWAGWLLLPVLIAALVARKHFLAKLVLFTTPLSAVALMVYSGSGITYYGIAHLIAFAIALDALVRAPAWRALLPALSRPHGR